MNKSSLLFLLFLLTHFLSTLSGQVVLRSEQSEWNVGISGFTGDLTARYEYLKSSLPDLIKRELDQAGTHILSEAEKEQLRTVVFEEKRISLIKEMGKIIKEKDLILFNKSSSNSTVDEKLIRIEDISQEISELEISGISVVEVPSMLPILWSEPDENDSIINTENYSPSVICSKGNLDFLIYGRIRQIDEYFRLEIHGYSKAENDEILVYSGTSSPDLLSGLAEEAAGELRAILLGRAWASLNLVTDNPEALIYSNGELIGVGTASVNTLEPGSVFLEAVGQDKSYWSQDVELEALENLDINAELTVSEISTLTISSEPEGADVYMGARWVGTTPMELPRYEDRSYWLSLKNDGYYDRSFEISPQMPDFINIELELEEMTRIEFFDLKKKEFYRSLGRFSLSVAGPVISAGIYSNYINQQNIYAALYDTTKNPEYYDLAVEMERNYYISNGVFWGTIGISGGLLVDVFVKLSRYIKAAEALAE